MQNYLLYNGNWCGHSQKLNYQTKQKKKRQAFKCHLFGIVIYITFKCVFDKYTITIINKICNKLMNVKSLLNSHPFDSPTCQYIWFEMCLAFCRVLELGSCWSSNICNLRVRVSVSFIYSKHLLNFSFIVTLKYLEKRTFLSW